MSRLLQRLAHPALTLAGALGLAASLMLGQGLSAACALLALNLAAALLHLPRLRRGGLGVFHIGLLLALLLAAAGWLARFEGRVEVAEGTDYDPAALQPTYVGPWAGEAWRQLRFSQGGVQVDYAPDWHRGRTRSQVRTEAGWQTVGDDTPLQLQGYRLYTTPNKGLALRLRWQRGQQAPLAGLVHLPSYPLHDWRQENQWTAPDAGHWQFALAFDQPTPSDRAWTLDPPRIAATLRVQAQGQTWQLRPGESLTLNGVRLHYDGLAGWMGYRVYRDPMLLPLLLTALVAGAGLGWHLLRRSPRPARSAAAWEAA